MKLGKSDRLFFIRHGETDWNATGRMQGQQDVVLNARGYRQAEQVGKKLRNSLGIRAEDIETHFNFVASPLLRTRQTMEIARQELGLPVRSYAMEDRLKEITFGRWEGLTWPQVTARDPALAAMREADKWGFVPPGGESYAMVAERIRPWLDDISGDSIIVSHGGIARILMALICGVDPSVAPNLDIWQGRVLVFQGGKSQWL